MPPFPSSDRVLRWPVRTYVKVNNVELYTPNKEDAEAVYGETNDRPLLGDFVTARSILDLERPRRAKRAERPESPKRPEKPGSTDRTDRPGRPGRPGRPERPDTAGRPESPDGSDRTDGADSTDRTDVTVGLDDRPKVQKNKRPDLNRSDGRNDSNGPGSNGPGSDIPKKVPTHIGVSAEPNAESTERDVVVAASSSVMDTARRLFANVNDAPRPAKIVATLIAILLLVGTCHTLNIVDITNVAMSIYSNAQEISIEGAVAKMQDTLVAGVGLAVTLPFLVVWISVMGVLVAYIELNERVVPTLRGCFDMKDVSDNMKSHVGCYVSQYTPSSYKEVLLLMLGAIGVIVAAFGMLVICGKLGSVRLNWKKPRGRSIATAIADIRGATNCASIIKRTLGMEGNELDGIFRSSGDKGLAVQLVAANKTGLFTTAAKWFLSRAPGPRVMPLIKESGVLGITHAQETHISQTVDEDHAIVDPAGLCFIEKNLPEGARELSEAIYRFVGIVVTNDKGEAKKAGVGFPDEVQSAVTEPYKAAHHMYTRDGKTTHVIHVVGPDFRQKTGIMWHDAISELSKAYSSVIDVAEHLQGVNVIRLPIISGGVFAGKFKECVPELTARAVCAAFGKSSLQKEYWLCTYEGDTRPFDLAFKFARSTQHYNYSVPVGPVGPVGPVISSGPVGPVGSVISSGPVGPVITSGIKVTEEEHEYGAVGYAIKIKTSTKIGIMVAGNSGRPGGGVGRGLENVPTIDHKIAFKGYDGQLTTQEESIVGEWLYGEFPEHSDNASRESLFRSTICGMWGQTQKQKTTTIQGVDYTIAKASGYADAWVVRDAKLRSRAAADPSPISATLVFVAGPNATSRKPKSKTRNSKNHDDYGSMPATVNKRATTEYAFFKECVEASVRAGLMAMVEENVTHALVARVSCAVYAGVHKSNINKEFKKLVQRIVDSLHFKFEQVAIVTVPAKQNHASLGSSVPRTRRA
jgi:hypothetical protein